MCSFLFCTVIADRSQDVRRLSDIAEQFGDSDPEAVRDLTQARERNVRFSALDIAHIRPVQSAPVSKFFLAPSALFAQAADPFSQSKE
jgi:hypothetical protein